MIQPRCFFMRPLEWWPYVTRCTCNGTTEVLYRGERVIACDDHAEMIQNIGEQQDA